MQLSQSCVTSVSLHSSRRLQRAVWTVRLATAMSASNCTTPGAHLKLSMNMLAPQQTLGPRQVFSLVTIFFICYFVKTQTDSQKYLHSLGLWPFSGDKLSHESKINSMYRFGLLRSLKGWLHWKFLIWNQMLMPQICHCVSFAVYCIAHSSLLIKPLQCLALLLMRILAIKCADWTSILRHVRKWLTEGCLDTLKVSVILFLFSYCWSL